jgi:hypothetical protein
MLDFIFFDVGLRDRFVASLQEKSITTHVQDDHFGWTVHFDEMNLSDEAVHDIETEYEALEMEQMHLIEQEEGGVEKHAAGFEVRLPEGGSVMVSIPPALAARLVQEFTFDEIQEMFSSVAAAAIHPDHRPLCQREN